MTFIYPAVFRKETDSYWVEFPDLEGCHTCGANLTDAMEAAQEALTGYILTLFEQNKRLAVPSDISSVHAESGFVTLVPGYVDFDENNPLYLCGKCGHRNPSGSLFCNRCGNPVGLNFSDIPESVEPLYYFLEIFRDSQSLDSFFSAYPINVSIESVPDKAFKKIFTMDLGSNFRISLLEGVYDVSFVFSPLSKRVFRVKLTHDVFLHMKGKNLDSFPDGVDQRM